MPIQPKTVKTYTPSQIYGDAGLIYIRYHGRIEAKPGGQKKIGGDGPPLARYKNRWSTDMTTESTTRYSWVGSSSLDAGAYC